MSLTGISSSYLLKALRVSTLTNYTAVQAGQKKPVLDQKQIKLNSCSNEAALLQPQNKQQAQ
jgi:hypothetical protein